MFLPLAIVIYATCHVPTAEGERERNSTHEIGSRDVNARTLRGQRNHDHRPGMYGYDGGPGVQAWGDLCKTGRNQSPIDFKVVEHVTFRPLEWSHGFSESPVSIELENTGHGVQVIYNTRSPIKVTGGPLQGETYQFQQLHFHWGRNSNEGSEHTISSRRFPLECHLVFKKTVKSGKEKNLLLVIGVLYKVSLLSDKFLGVITQNVHHVAKAGAKYKIKGGYPLRNFLPDHMDSYHFYKGSLTTPPCSETVDWMVMAEPKPALASQIAMFRNIIKDHRGFQVTYNFRPTKQLHGRHVYLAHSTW